MSNNLGFGVMIRMLSGDRGGECFLSAVGKYIQAIEIHDSELRLTFGDGSRVKLFDDGQSCCEHRYMTCDDDLSYYIGAQLLDAEIKDAPDAEDEYGVHEVQFLEVKTSKGSFTVASHNEHNGYYGGFWIKAAEMEDAK